MANNENVPFGALLRRLRETAGLTQEELAERAELSPNAISALERGERQRPYPNTVRALADALGLDPDERSRLMAARAPRSVTTETRSAPLPVPLTPLFGREHDIARVLESVGEANARLVTLTGPGGVGKTRLALAAAQALAERRTAEVYFIELAALRDADLVLPTIARALGLAERAATAPLPSRLADALRQRDVLLVLDNLEQVTAVGPDLAALLAACPRLRLLTTSRAALRVRGEHVYAVEPLPLPAPSRTPAAAAIAASPAVALFVAAARSARADFALTDANAADVAAICRRLDGLPLAIELAAARTSVLSPAALLARLTSRLRVLTVGPSDLPPRQQRLRDAIAWSYDLLAPAEQALFRDLAVFVGGFTLDAVEHVVDGGPSVMSDDNDAPSPLDGLTSLVAQNLVRSELGAGDEPRFRMLETIREYATERLTASGETEEVRQRHAGYYAGVAEDAAPHLTGADQATWLDRLTAEHDNLRAALAWAQESGSHDLGLRLVAALSRFWFTRGYLSEGRRSLEQALESGQTQPPALRAAALAGAGKLAFQQGDLASAAALYEESLAVKRTLGDTQGIAGLLSSLGNVARERGDLPRAIARYEESLHLLRALGDTAGIASVLNNLGTAARYRGDLTRARALHAESLSLRRAAGDTWGIGYTLTCLGLVAYDRGDLDEAGRVLGEALAHQRRLGDNYGTAHSLAVLGDVARVSGDLARAATAVQESHELFQELGDAWGIATSLHGLAQLARLRGEMDGATTLEVESLRLFYAAHNGMAVAGCLEALAFAWLAGGRAQPARLAKLLAAADALRAALGTPVPPVERARLDAMRDDAERALGHDGFAAAWEEGGRLSLAEAVALAMADSREGGADPDDLTSLNRPARFSA